MINIEKETRRRKCFIVITFHGVLWQVVLSGKKQSVHSDGESLDIAVKNAFKAWDEK